MNPISKDISFVNDDRWVTPGRSYRCEAEEISRARIRGAALRSKLGAIGSGTGESLDNVLATLIREGDAFDKWRGSREALRNLQVVRRTRGIVTPVASLHSSSHLRIDLQRTEDSQLEIWECGDDMELRFPVFRLPLSNFEDGRVTRINQRLRPDVLLSFDFKNDGDCATFAAGLNASPPVISQNIRHGARDLLSNGIALWSRVFSFLKPKFNAIVEFRSAQLHPWQHHDVRNDPLYRLADLWRPAMSLQ